MKIKLNENLLTHILIYFKIRLYAFELENRDLGGTIYDNDE